MKSNPSSPRRAAPGALLAALAASLLVYALGSTPQLPLAIAWTVGHAPWMHAIYPALSALGAAGALLSIAGGLRSLRHRQQRRALKQDRTPACITESRIAGC